MISEVSFYLIQRTFKKLASLYHDGNFWKSLGKMLANDMLQIVCKSLCECIYLGEF